MACARSVTRRDCSSLRPQLSLVLAAALLITAVTARNEHHHGHDPHHRHHHHHSQGPDHPHSHAHSHGDAHHHSHPPSKPSSFLPALLHRLLLPLHTLPPQTAALTASALVSSASLVSLLLLPIAAFAGSLLLPFAAGALLADVFHHLLPLVYASASADANHSHPHGDPITAQAMLAAAAVFFVLDAVLRRLSGPAHSHPHTHIASANGTRSAAYINLAADALHNFCDGLSLGAAFLASPAAGVATTVAIVLHEIPQEIADYAVLLRAGFSRPTALAANVLCAATALAGTAAALRAAEVFEQASSVVLPFAAGALLYMTFVTVIPDVLEDVGKPVSSGKDGESVPVGVPLFVARIVVALAAAAAGVFVVGLVESVHEH